MDSGSVFETRPHHVALAGLKCTILSFSNTGITRICNHIRFCQWFLLMKNNNKKAKIQNEFHQLKIFYYRAPGVPQHVGELLIALKTSHVYFASCEIISLLQPFTSSLVYHQDTTISSSSLGASGC